MRRRGDFAGGLDAQGSTGIGVQRGQRIEPMGDARAVTHFGYQSFFVRTEDAGQYRRPLAGRAAGLLKHAPRRLNRARFAAGIPNFGPPMSGTSDVADTRLRARTYPHDFITGCRVLPDRRAS